MAEQLDDTTGAFREVPRYCTSARYLRDVACSDEPGLARYDVVTTTGDGREMLRTVACEVHGREEVRRSQMAGQIATTELRGPFMLLPPELPQPQTLLPTHAKVTDHDVLAGTVDVEVRVDVVAIVDGMVELSAGGKPKRLRPGDSAVLRATLALPEASS